MLATLLRPFVITPPKPCVHIAPSHLLLLLPPRFRPKDNAPMASPQGYFPRIPLENFATHCARGRQMLPGSLDSSDSLRPCNTVVSSIRNGATHSWNISRFAHVTTQQVLKFIDTWDCKRRDLVGLDIRLGSSWALLSFSTIVEHTECVCLTASTSTVTSISRWRKPTRATQLRVARQRAQDTDR